MINQMSEKGPAFWSAPLPVTSFPRNSQCLTALLVQSNKFAGISRHAEGANHVGSQGFASPVTELQPGRGAPKSIRRWKPSPETYPASDGVAQRLERLTVNQRVDGSNPSTIANAGLAQLVERLPCKQDISGSSPLTGTNTTGKGTLRRRRSPCLAEGSNPYEVPLPL